MKTGLFLLLLSGLSCHLAAQHHLGVRGGYGGGMSRIEYSKSDLNGSRDNRFWFGAPSAGVSWKYYSVERNVGGIQVDLQMVKKGYEEQQGKKILEDGLVTYDSTYQRTLSAIEIPMMWQPHVYLFNKRARAYMNLGVYFSYMFDSHEKLTLEDGTVRFDRPYDIISVRDNRFEFGLCGGVGVSVLFNRIEAFVEARYSFGYSDLIKARAKYPESNYNRTPVDMLNVSLGVYYRLGKGGILSLEAPRNRVKKERWEEMPSGPPNRGNSSGSGSGSAPPAASGNQQQQSRPGPMMPAR